MTELYIIQSELNNDKFYLGISNRKQERLAEHNRGQTYSTRRWQPWKLIYQESFKSKGDAMKRESYLKSVKGYKERLEIINKYKCGS